MNFLPSTINTSIFSPHVIPPRVFHTSLGAGPTVWVVLPMVPAFSSSPESLRSVPGICLIDHISRILVDYKATVAQSLHHGIKVWTPRNYRINHALFRCRPHVADWDVTMCLVSWSNLPSPLSCLLNLSLYSSILWRTTNSVHTPSVFSKSQEFDIMGMHTCAWFFYMGVVDLFVVPLPFYLIVFTCTRK